MSVRRPAVAGTFYPRDAAELAAAVDALLARTSPAGTRPAKALVAPHAGYVFSGPVAATAYAALATQGASVTRVVLLGPAHRTPLIGMAVPSVDAFRTPLGDVAVDTEARAVLLEMPGVAVDDRAHADEHSLEVHLPFLQRALDAFTIVPIVVGRCEIALIAHVLDALWGGPETLVVVSSDLSHYEGYEAAAQHDRTTADEIVARIGEHICVYDACGSYPIRGLLEVANARDLDVALLDLRSSGDTTGPRDRVVGYGAFALSEP
jgi:AmmeMemoRadiSam system protein B